MKEAQFRFYGELNDFLSASHRYKVAKYRFIGNPAIKDAIENLGVPHPEVYMILINQRPVSFMKRVNNSDYVSVYPYFRNLDVPAEIRAGVSPFAMDSFIVDNHLGKLAGYLRMLGFDTLYCNRLKGSRIIKEAHREQRVFLTRNRMALKNSKILYGYYVRANIPTGQLEEIYRQFRLGEKMKSFGRCISCNGLLVEVEKEEISGRLEPKTKKYYQEFRICSCCNKLFWAGSHYKKMEGFIRKLQSMEPSATEERGD